MHPIPPIDPVPGAVVKLTLPGGQPLPGERIKLTLGQAQVQEDAFETTWLPTPAERARIAAGAPVQLQLLGRLHPPVQMDVGAVPDGALPVYDGEEIALALGLMYAWLRTITHGDDAQVADMPEVLVRADEGDPLIQQITMELWGRAASDRLEMAVQQVATQRSRNGASAGPAVDTPEDPHA